VFGIPQTGAVIGNNPLYNHGIGNAPGIAIDPINGDIYHTAASSPPGHNGLRLFASNGGNQADFLGGVDGFPQVLSSAWDLQWFESPSENLLFVLNSVQRSPKALLFNGVSFSFSGHYQSAPTGPATRQMTINPNNNKIYATDQEYRVYEWNPSDSTSPTKEVLFDDTNLQAASGLAFDELNNLYVTEEVPGSPNVGEVQIYKYTPNAGGTWEFDSVLATIEENVGIGNPGQWLQYVDAVPVCAGSCPGDLADGDFDASGLVDLEDLNFVLFNWNELGENLPAEWTHMRPDQGDAVSLVELNKVLFTWNQSGPSTAAVPEPTALCLLVIGLVALVAGQRGAC